MGWVRGFVRSDHVRATGAPGRFAVDAPHTPTSLRLWGAGGRMRGCPGAAPAGSWFGKMLRRWAPGCTRPCTGEHTWSISGPQTPRGPRSRSSCTPSDLGFYGAPGRIRTCGRRIRSPVLYPLSYGCSVQLSPTAAEHGPGPSLLPGECCVPKRGGACWGSYGRKVPCRGTSGVPGRHSRVFGRCRPR